MQSSTDHRLRVRMLATLCLLCMTMVVVAVVSGVAVAWLGTLAYVLVRGVAADFGLLSFALPPGSTVVWFAAAGTVAVVGAALWNERNAPAYAVASVGAERVDESTHSRLVTLVGRVAHQVDAPAPAVYVAETDTPISMTTGFRPSSAHLVVSRGMLDALDGRELEAVVAHELAHVANRDTAVMTAATLPTSAAERVREFLAGPTPGTKHGLASRADYADVVMSAGLYLAYPVWVAARLLTASLSRTREFAADDGAVAITGDPVALASALEKIDDRIAARSATDFRRTEVAAFAIVEPDKREYYSDAGILLKRIDDAFSTHPPTERRVERLRSVVREQERSG